jgi:hypothetical protein
MFRKLNLFPSSGDGRETSTLLGPLRRANLSLWTKRENIQKQKYLLIFKILIIGLCILLRVYQLNIGRPPYTTQYFLVLDFIVHHLKMAAKRGRNM